jgi:hypothetical protein
MIEARTSPQNVNLGERGPAIAANLARLEALAAEFAAILVEVRALVAGDIASKPLADDPLVPIAVAAQLCAVSKGSARKQAKRLGLAILEGGRVKIHLSAVAALYPRALSTLSSARELCPSGAKPAARVPSPGGRDTCTT